MPEGIRFSFKEMCAKFSVTPRTLRYYEYIELLQPERVGHSRFYGPREVARMTLILRGKRFGFSLEDIRQWLLVYHERGTRQQLEYFLSSADRQLRVLVKEHDTLGETIKDLKSLRKDVEDELSNLT